MALRPRMKSRLADSMESWALLWEDSGWVWYTLVSEHEDLPGFLSSDAKRSQPRGWKSLGGCSVLLFPTSDVPQQGTWLWAD